MNYVPDRAERSRFIVVIGILLIISIAIRILVLHVSYPDVRQDTETYYLLIEHMLRGDFSEYVAHRTPIYSIFILICNQNQHIILILQAVLGVGTGMALFWICYSYTRDLRPAFMAGLVHSVSLNQLAFETRIMPETLTTFFIVLSLVLVTRVTTNRGETQQSVAAAAGFTTALTALTRPLYVFLGPLLALVLAVFGPERGRTGRVLLVAFAVPVLGWMLFNKITADYFGLQSVAGFGITNHSGRMMEKAGDEYAVIRDIYLKYREKNIAETGSHSMTIFLAREEMLEKTGLSEVELSRQLSALSLDLFMRYPIPYLKNVLEAWIDFWRIRLDIGENFNVSAARNLTYAIWRIERWVLMILNAIGLMFGGFIIVHTAWRRLYGRSDISMLFIIASIPISASIIQALAEYGENSRYAIPTQSLMMLLAILFVWERRKGHSLAISKI